MSIVVHPFYIEARKYLAPAQKLSGRHCLTLVLIAIVKLTSGETDPSGGAHSCWRCSVRSRFRTQAGVRSFIITFDVYVILAIS